MDLDQLEHFFLNGSSSPSALSDYSSYIPWQPSVPIKPQDSLSSLKEGSVIGTAADCGNQSVISTDNFIKLDEQVTI